ncbi:MAG TPA: TolC family protein [Cyclobacteriaceae bacterium]|nr:TolC family protein [Cyclobacteriaceae bacterium]
MNGLKSLFIAGILFLPFTLKAAAADTLTVTLHQADSIFITRNYYLLASSMNIEAQRAQELQARLFINPVITADFNAYDPQNDEFFHVGETGQKSFQIDQLILLGGKRRFQIDMAKTNTAIAELEFQNLTRQLKFKLHTKLVEIGQQQVLLQKYNAQLVFLDTIMTSYERQVAKGNIPLKDFVRLKGVYLNLNNDRAELLHRYFEAQTDVQTLLQTQQNIAFEFSDQDIDAYIKVRNLDDLKAEALANHPELQIMRQNKILAEQYLQYQKKLAIPDINLFTSYDQRGGAFLNQINAGIAIPLPLWNRNQGNIKSAGFRIQEEGYYQQAKQQEMLSNVQNNFALYSQTVSEYQKATGLYSADFEVTIKGMADNFQKRNVSMIEFVDFFESYNQVLAELARMKTQLVTSAELLNLSIGKDVY